MPEYISIKESVLRKLETHLPEIRERFGIETLGIFGSVARGEDTPDSDVDVLYRFHPDSINYETLLDLSDYLETLFDRNVDLISIDAMRYPFKKYAEMDMILTSELPGVS